ncbi:hypothetical protein [Desulfosporosinus shakirovi]|uniref:hypothetical protein n=1 Tax=Desulfosporosinus shakirovi TaxID=2885154 RepID=UPI001E3A222A|nr:hypothetical protein [Desulfosporosinus sp. SRJS8]MCB8817375.1 hypothetical protein [Desulfosporosinus sp. SRJS8]
MELKSVDPNQGYLADMILINFLIALGSNTNLHGEIDSIYSSNKLEYYDFYRKSRYKNNRLIFSFPTLYTEQIIKVIGIYYWCNERNQYDLVTNFVRLGYKKVLNYVINNEVIYLDDFVNKIFDNTHKFNKVTNQEFNSILAVMFFLCFNQDKTCELGSIGNDIRMKFFEDYNFEKGLPGHEEVGPQHKAKVKELHDVYWLSSKSKNKTLDQLMEANEYQISKELDTILHSRRRKINKYYEILLSYFKSLGIGAYVFAGESIITSKDFDKLCETFYREQSDGSLTDEECDFFIITCLLISAFVAEYENTRKIYLSNAKDDYYLDTLNLKLETEAKLELLRKEKADFKSEIVRLEDLMLSCQDEASRWQREATRLQQELNQAELNKKELLALRDFVFEQQTSKEELEDDSNDYSRALESLGKHNYVITGGHANLIKGLKEILPNLIYLDMDNLHKDLRFLDNQEAVFVNTAYLSHAFYYKVMSRMETNKTRLFYLSSSSVRGVVLKMSKLLGI